MATAKTLTNEDNFEVLLPKIYIQSFHLINFKWPKLVLLYEVEMLAKHCFKDSKRKKIIDSKSQ